ncbi:hypothetical protein ABT266_29540, partial [Amycolatopsis sp. NPDC000746]
MEPLGGRISGRRLATLLGEWRQRGSRQGASDLAAAVELHVLDGQLPIGTARSDAPCREPRCRPSTS